MSPIFQPDFASVESNIPVHPKGRYRVKVTGKKPRVGEGKDENTGQVTQNAHMQYNLELVGKLGENGNLVTEDFAGRTVQPYKVWLHSEGGWSFAKPFLMAAAGFSPRKQENEANEALFDSREKWMFQGEKDDPPENFQLGPSWDIPVNRVLDVNLSVKITKRDDVTYENQDFSGWTPVE